METDVIVTQTYSSPCGELILGSFKDRLCLCKWDKTHGTDTCLERVERYLKARKTKGCNALIDNAKRQLDEYFEGKRHRFEIPVLLCGTEFQRRTWEELTHIRYGETISYAEEALRMHSKKAVRAVANANHANVISIIVPCHRVIGSTGKLVGYGGGLEVKRFLLNLEASHTPPYFGLFSP